MLLPGFSWTMGSNPPEVAFVENSGARTIQQHASSGGTPLVTLCKKQLKTTQSDTEPDLHVKHPETEKSRAEHN